MTRRGRREQRRAARGTPVAPASQLELAESAPEPAEEPPGVWDFEAYTVPELRQMATERGIVLGKARTKAAIIRALRS